MTIKTWNIKEMTGYEPITTDYEDFSIADKFGASAIKDTFVRLFKEQKEDYKELTELVMALNWKSWEHQDDDLCGLYCRLWTRADSYACHHLKGEELSYFYRTTD